MHEVNMSIRLLALAGLLAAMGQLAACGALQKNRIAATSSDSNLNETFWLAEDINGRGVIDMLRSTIEFESAERVLVNGGCNRGFGNVSISGNNLAFGAFGITPRACAESILNQETDFLQALGATRSYKVDAASDLLYFYAEDGSERLRFSRSTRQ